MKNSSTFNGLSLFQALLASYISVGALVVLISIFVFISHEKTVVQAELKSQFRYLLSNAVGYFDEVYAARIQSDLQYVEGSTSFANYLSSQKNEIFLTKSGAEKVLLSFSGPSKGMYLSTRYLDATGQEKIITAGKKRLRVYTSLSDHPDTVLYAHIYALYKRLEKEQPGTILSDGPFKYGGKNTFLAGLAKSEPEIGGFGGAVIFHCDLSDYFDYLRNVIVYNEPVAQLFDAHGNELTYHRLRAAGDTVPDFLTVTAPLAIGKSGQILCQVVLRVSPHIFYLFFRDAIKNSLLFLIVISVILTVVAFIISRYFAKPLVMLSATVDRFAKGELAARCQAKASGEIGTLVRSFNHMAEELDKTTVSRDALAQEVKERKKAEENLARAYLTLKETQYQLIQSSKMAAMGQLAAGVSHELNQPLTGIRGFAQAMLMDIDAASPLRPDLEKIIEQADRMDKIIKNVRFFSRKSEFVMEELDINKPILDSCALLREQFKVRNIELKLSLAADLPRTKGDLNQLQQVFINLITNARDAIEHARKKEGGMLVIATRLLPGSQAIEITVADNGTGIPDESLEHVFTPFFTTKSPDGGMGLGLAIVYRIVDNHQGKIRVESKQGEGAKFIITLPLTRPIV